MPSPRWATTNYELTQRPHTATEIIGRGVDNRKSKTFLKDLETAQVYSEIMGHYRMLVETFRDLHYHHYGKVLKDDEIAEEYDSVRTWRDKHAEHMGHAASIDGFSVRAVSGASARDDGQEPRKRRTSTTPDDAGTNGHGDAKWR